jgi:hypothetical protein
MTTLELTKRAPPQLEHPAPPLAAPQNDCPALDINDMREMWWVRAWWLSAAPSGD